MEPNGDGYITVAVGSADAMRLTDRNAAVRLVWKYDDKKLSLTHRAMFYAPGYKPEKLSPFRTVAVDSIDLAISKVIVPYLKKNSAKIAEFYPEYIS
jgi:hypothetical protein